ncbi:MAG TPA: hypothetical protein VMI54_06835 [Polyangiaceae bacterium]|nr:hypothetical protein [Polyangiaceae bacterium]
MPAPSVGRLGTPTGFELTASASGATLVWSPVARDTGALRKVELDANGAFAGPASVVVDASAVTGDVTDLAAAWVKDRLALAWVERDGAKARVRAAWAQSGAAPFELGAAWSGPRTARGNVVIAAREDHALVFSRGDQSACVDADRHGCFAFEFHELTPSGLEKSGLPMSVPVPCADNSTQIAVVGRRFHYGVCTDTGERAVTTMFTIERDPDYARADRLLEGCTPAGTFVWQGAAWLIAECENGRRAVRLGARDEPAQYLDLHTLGVECRHGTTTLHAPSLDLLLDEPRVGLAGLLPQNLAPAGARAVWTGRALVVGTTLADRVHLARYTCAGDTLKTETLDVQ